MILIFTDLDGTLLDHDTYSWQPAVPALSFLRERSIPWILCTSKTRAEVERLRAEMGHTHPFIVENGGGIYIPRDTFPFETPGATRAADYDLITLGADYTVLIGVLVDAARRTGTGIRAFHQMSPADVAAVTAVNEEIAVLSKQREFDEPFSITAGNPRPLLEAIEQAGYRWTQGGRFYHIIGASDKTHAVDLLTGFYRRKYGALTTIGLGDGPNDAGFLNAADVAVIVRSAKVEQVRRLVPRGRVTAAAGPEGWNEALLELLR